MFLYRGWSSMGVSKHTHTLNSCLGYYVIILYCIHNLHCLCIHLFYHLTKEILPAYESFGVSKHWQCSSWKKKMFRKFNIKYNLWSVIGAFDVFILFFIVFHSENRFDILLLLVNPYLNAGPISPNKCPICLILNSRIGLHRVVFFSIWIEINDVKVKYVSKIFCISYENVMKRLRLL